MALCCDFLAWRMHISTDFEPRCTIEERYSELVEHHNVAWVNILNTAAAYCYAVLGVTDKIPKAFKEHNLGSVNILAPGRPMAELAENRVYSAQGAYAKAIGQNERQAAICEKCITDLLRFICLYSRRLLMRCSAGATRRQSLLATELSEACLVCVFCI